MCNVVTEGNYNNKSSTNLVLGHDSEKKGLNFRKPVGVAALDITDQFTFKQGKASQLVTTFSVLFCIFFLTLLKMNFQIRPNLEAFLGLKFCEFLEDKA